MLEKDLPATIIQLSGAGACVFLPVNIPRLKTSKHCKKMIETWYHQGPRKD